MKLNQRRLSSEQRLALGLFGLLMVIYTYVFPRWADPNQNSRLDMVFAVVEDGTFQIDKYVGNTVDYAKVGDHYYSDKAPGVAFLGIPIYAALKPVLDSPLMDGVMTRLADHEAFKATLRAEGSGILEHKVRFAIAQVAIAFVIGVIPSALLGVLIFVWLAEITPQVWPRLAVVIGYGLLTPAFAYANSLFGHQLSAALLFGAFAWLSLAQRPLPLWALLAIGVLLSYAVVTEYPTALMTGVIYLYGLYRLFRLGQWWGIMPVTLAAAGVAVGWMAYNTSVFGGPLNLGYSYSDLWIEKHHTGFMSLTLPHGEAIWGITFGVFRGLFVLSPLLLLAVPGFVLWWRTREQRPEFWVALACVAAIFLFNSSSVMWWGGFAVGPRYLLPALPFMALPVAFVLRRWGSQAWLKITLALLGTWSLAATWGLTLAEQAFPPDTIPNPLLDYALPNWLAGNIARNLGTLLGLRGAWGLGPLLIFMGLIALWCWWLARRRGIEKRQTLHRSPEMAS